MDAVNIARLTLCLLIHLLRAFAYEGCLSPQYLELHQTGTIECFFQEGSYGIYWYDSTEIATKEPILNFKDASKSGSGFTSGDFDIHPNGSLIINNVTVHHERNFTVVKFNSSQSTPLQINVEIITIVHPHHDFPIITNCKDQKRACLLHVNGTMQLHCSVRGVRPMVSLTWSVRGITGQEHTSSAMTFENDTLWYTSHATATTTSLSTSFLRLYVCKAVSVYPLLRFSESYVVAERGLLNLPSMESATRYFKRDSEMELFCNEGNLNFLVWIQTSEFGDQFENKRLAIYVNGTFQEVYSEDFEIGGTGSLILRHVKTSHEGKYTCLFGNGLADGKGVYQVAVYVDPKPENPMITGCEDKPHCLLDVGNEGMLTCYINGIRPEVQLVLRPLYVPSPTTISFHNQKTNVKKNGDTFDITVTSHFVAKTSENSRIPLECKVVGPNTDLFDLRVQIDLWVKANCSTTEDVNKTIDEREPACKNQSLMISLLVAAFLIIVIEAICIVIGSYSLKTKGVYGRWRGRANQKLNVEENVSMISTERHHNNQLNLAEKKAIFIEELKVKYQILCDSVQPIPYLKEKLYCVNSIFTECEIEARVNKAKEKTEIWKTVDSYHNVLTDTRHGPMRSIVQGDAGFGKSTLTLQLAYEWCNNVTSSPSNVEILVLLRLRQLGKTSSIFKAMRQYLLPKDSVLTENDIRNILQSTASALIILDGYDEYPIQEQEDETDIMLIIKREMLQKIPVIVTTRSACLPDDYPPCTKHFRLNGFSETARERYIHRVVVPHDVESAEKIKQRLKENPVLSDLCHVPLFLVMFAHMTYESDEFQKFHSVTNFFAYMISCFHSHMRKKVKEKAKLEKFEQFQDDHRKLDKLSLEMLSANKKQIVWDKDDIIRLLGQDFYEHYVRIGLLVEEDVLDERKEPELFRYKTEVRFYHNIFCEWYAAHLLSEYAAKENPKELRQILKHLNPNELHYVYRFACGLQTDAANNILTYLRSITEGQEFIALCTLEQKKKVEDIKDIIIYLSSDVVSLTNKINKLQLRSVIQILEIASTNLIPVPIVCIENCFQHVECSTWKISLGSGLFFSNLSSMKELRIYEVGRELTNQEVEGIYKFSSHCLNLETLRFDCCLLPMSISAKRDEDHVNKNQIEVLWNPIGTWYCWNHKANFWEERYNKVPMTPQQYNTETLRFRKEWSHTNWQVCTNNAKKTSE